MLLLLLHELRVVAPCHGVEVLPTGDLSSRCVFLDTNLLEASACGRTAMIAEIHAAVIVVTVIALHIEYTDVAHLAVSLRLARELAPAILAHGCLAVSVGANLHAWRYVSIVVTLRLRAAPGHILLLRWHASHCSLRLLSAALFEALFELHLLVPHWIQILL